MKQLKITRRITNRDGAILDRYLSEISKIPLLSQEEEVEVGRKARHGDRKAIDLLINSNLLFVVSVAKQYQNQGLPLSDLINEGNVGLTKAATRFDETKGFKFISYAVWWIRQTILVAIAEQTRIVRMPVNQIGVMDRVYRFSAEFEQQHFRRPTHTETCEAFGLDEVPFLEFLALYQREFSSLDRPFSEEEGADTLLDVFSDTTFDLPDMTFEKQENGKVLVGKIRTVLTKKESDVIVSFYGLDGHVKKSLSEIGDENHLNKERIRQIKDKAIKKLKRALA